MTMERHQCEDYFTSRPTGLGSLRCSQHQEVYARRQIDSSPLQNTFRILSKQNNGLWNSDQHEFEYWFRFAQLSFSPQGPPSKLPSFTSITTYVYLSPIIEINSVITLFARSLSIQTSRPLISPTFGNLTQTVTDFERHLNRLCPIQTRITRTLVIF